MPLTLDQVKHIAKLVKLDISGQEEKLAKMLDQTLDYISILKELDTKSEKETYQVTGLTDVFQTAKHPKNTFTQEEALQNAKDKQNGLFVTKGVFDR